MPYEHLNAAERQVIQRAREAGQAFGAIAQTLGRNPSTISREWRRKSCSGSYDADEAQQQARNSVPPSRATRLETTTVACDRWSFRGSNENGRLSS